MKKYMIIFVMASILTSFYAFGVLEENECKKECQRIYNECIMNTETPEGEGECKFDKLQCEINCTFLKY